MKILILEDRGSVSFYMQEMLESEGHTTIPAFSIPDARTILKNDGIDCIITDLNMDPWGLSPSQIRETRDGLLTGWIWLRDEVIKEKPHMKNRTIIYSEYGEALRKHIPEEELIGFRLISKSGPTSSAEQVLLNLKEISKL